MFFDTNDYLENDKNFQKKYKLIKYEGNKIIFQVFKYFAKEWTRFPYETEVAILTEQFLNKSKIFNKLDNQIQYLFLEALSYYIWYVINDPETKKWLIKKNHWINNDDENFNNIFNK